MHAPAPQPAPTKALLSEFDRWHRQVCDGVPAVIQGGKDAKLIAALFRSHGEDLVRALMAEYFESRDPWIRKQGYSVGKFIASAPQLIAARTRRTRGEAPRVSTDWQDECQQLHGGRCRTRFFHEAVMRPDDES